MARFKLVIFVILISKVPFLCDAVKGKRMKEIEERVNQFGELFNAGKFKEIGEMHTEDAIYLPNDGNITIGKAAIAEFYDNGFSGKNIRLDIYTNKVFGRGSFLAAFGECDIYYPNGSLIIHIRFIANFKRIGEEWMIAGNVENTGPRE
ncbi:unnamed protein product [Owenia fusiformis]|uniref:DUF4440 domain-containing protein n=1 Tax=Owenia fusiformis TaxID=6347 RepID=A0A8S4P0R9_OWEFU|nr:unnamed protein product [Owenia fusiformis]